ncbi:MAG: 4-hydroxybenzoate octaprenyltransferase [Oceanococcus sp.]
MVLQRLGAYARLIRLDRPIGIYLVLWPALWALWMAADGLPNGTILLVFVAGTILMRSAGCAINDFADRKIDGHVTRTKMRPLATGEMQAWEAIAIFIVLSLLAFGLALQLNRLALVLSIPAVILAASYPFAKRYTHLPQAHLGIAFAMGIPMAFAAVQNQVPLVAWLLFVATLLWVMVYDTFYAMVDRDDDLVVGVKSTAILFAHRDRLITALLQVCVVVLLVVVGCLQAYGVWFFAGVMLGACLFVWQQVLIRERLPEACLRAFLNNHRFGMAVFAGLLLETT